MIDLAAYYQQRLEYVEAKIAALRLDRDFFKQKLRAANDQKRKADVISGPRARRA